MEPCLQMFIQQGVLVVQHLALPQGQLYMQIPKIVLQLQILDLLKVPLTHSLVLIMIGIVTLIGSVCVFLMLLVRCLPLMPIKVHADHIGIMLSIRAMGNVVPCQHWNLLRLILNRFHHPIPIDQTALPVLNPLEVQLQDIIAAIFIIPDPHIN